MPNKKVRAQKINIKKVCRLCLSERGHLREIFSTKLPKMLEYCVSIKVSVIEGLPPFVCVSCFHLIAKFYTFKKKIEKNDRILRAYIKQNKVRQKDILDIAISEAQIESNNDEADDSTSEKDDIPLSKRTSQHEKYIHHILKKRKTSSAKINKLKSEDNFDKKNDENSCTFNYIHQPVKEIFNNIAEPPPLVPLEDDKKVGANEMEVIKKNLHQDALPPLVPIKQLSSVLVSLPTTPDLVEQNFKATKQQMNNSTINYSGAMSTNTNNKSSELNTNYHQTGGMLKCNICRKEFKDKKRLIGHLKGHIVTKEYGCKICGKRYPNPSTFRVHMRTHTGERPFKCQICDKGFVRWAGVVGHMRTHQSHKPFKCDTCGRTFKISSNLERHKVLHSESLPYCCNYCGKTFSQSDNLQLHIRTYHTNERPYLCNECGKGFVSSARLKRHMWVHTGYKPYMCKTCSKAYSNLNDLKNHQRISHLHNNTTTESETAADNKRYACTICDMKFHHPCRLNKHVKMHENRPFICSICSKSFSSSALLQRHLVTKKDGIHFGDLDFQVQVDEDNIGVEQILLEY